MVLVILAAVAAARADVPVKIATVPDGPIKLGVAEGAAELRRAFRLVPQGVDQVKLDQVRLLDCTDAHGQSCAARVEPGGCAGGCTLTATDAGSVTVVVTLPAPGTYTSSLEIVYVKEEKAQLDGKVQVIKAVLATALEITRPAPAAQPIQAMKLAVSGATGAEVDLAPGQRGTAIVRMLAQDDDGGARKLSQIAAAPLVRKVGNDSMASDAAVQLARRVGRERVPIVVGAPVELPPAGAMLEIEVAGLDGPGKYEGKLRLLADGRTPLEVGYTITVRDGVLCAALMIALGAMLSYGVQWWISKRRVRLVQQSTLERLGERVQELARRDGVADRDHRLLGELLHQLDCDLEDLDDDKTLADDYLARFARRVELAAALVKTGQDVERLPLAARGAQRTRLDAIALTLADRSADDAKLKSVETELATIAGTGVRRIALTELMTALDAAVDQARRALPTALHKRLADDVGGPLAAAHTAAGLDQLDALDDRLAAARLALARIQGAALAPRLPAAPPDIFAAPDDAPRYQALRNEVLATLTSLDAATEPDLAVQLYDTALTRVARELCSATARWCRAQADGTPDEAIKLRAFADEAEAARGKPAAEALEIIDRVKRDAAALVPGPEAKGIDAIPRSAAPRSALATIPHLGPIALPRPRRARRLLALGDVIVLVAVTLIAVASGLKLLWVGSPTWGGWGDWLTAILWGAGLHAVGNDRFKGLLGLKTDLGKIS